ncbi:hypothetical protein GGD72_000895 [Stenotrophomonas maltophilia]|uniref:hypothetical protein n=1 Tax=Stenotrophomonas maltophilia TaxID=40324 RepID=UPI00161E35C9|nr:hypothetical protein [Stenotrophomonas maltophilia]MBB5530133.1 hypothetical protein [Stenotrophomonas maltophilia]
MSSDKTKVIEYLFDLHWDEKAGRLKKTTMSLIDVGAAIRACNAIYEKNLSDRNPANFLKDIIRSSTANKVWPHRISKLRITGVQRTGKGDSFEFVPFKADQEEAFPDLFRHKPGTRIIDVQTVSIPLASKALGRKDEAWLVQTAVKLCLIEVLLATESSLAARQVTHLQMNVKLRSAEIDSLYLVDVPGEDLALATCEAKLEKERLLPDQIVAQVGATFESTEATMVIPMAMRAVAKVGVHVMQFEPVRRAEFHNFSELALAHEVLCRLKPAIKGIC